MVGRCRPYKSGVVIASPASSGTCLNGTVRMNSFLLIRTERFHLYSPDPSLNGAQVILPLSGPGWSFERLDATPETTRQFFSEVLPDLLALDDALCAEDAQREGVVSQFVRNPVGNFVSSSLTPMHFKDKLIHLH